MPELGKVVGKKLVQRGCIFFFQFAGETVPGINTYWKFKLLRRSRSYKARVTTAGDGDNVAVIKFGEH